MNQIDELEQQLEQLKDEQSSTRDTKQHQ